MSLIVAVVRRNELQVATDTITSFVDGREVELGGTATKHVVLPHLRLVVASRGHGSLLGFLVTAINSDSLPNGIDDVIANDGFHARAALAGIEMEGEVGKTRLWQNEVFIAGWSEKHKTMRAACYHEGGGYACHHHDAPIHYLTPTDIPSMALLDKTPKVRPAQIIQAAKEQHTVMADFGKDSSGGELWLTTLTPREATTRMIYQFDNYDRTARQLQEDCRESA